MSYKTFHCRCQTIGFLTSLLFISTVISGIILGWISDHVGRKFAMQISIFVLFINALLAYSATSIQLFYLIFLLTGIVNGAFWSVFLSFTLEFGTELERPTYVGLINTLIAPSTLVAQLLGGWLADQFSYRTTFLTAAAFGLFALSIIAQIFVPGPRQISSHRFT